MYNTVAIRCAAQPINEWDRRMLNSDLPIPCVSGPGVNVTVISEPYIREGAIPSCDNVKKGCISAKEYEAVFILNDLAMLLRDLVRGDTGEEPRYLGYLASVICKARDEVFDKEII